MTRHENPEFHWGILLRALMAFTSRTAAGRKDLASLPNVVLVHTRPGGPYAHLFAIALLTDTIMVPMISDSSRGSVILLLSVLTR